MTRFLSPLFMLLLLSATAGRAWALAYSQAGNDPLSESNYTEWPGIMPVVNAKARVYLTWVNGSEYLYYRGGTAELNAVLRDLAEVDTKVREVVLHPGPGHELQIQGKTLACNWELHLINGIAAHMLTLDKGDLIWSKSPVLTIYLGDGIDLKDLKVPEGIALLGPTDLKARYIEAITESEDKTVRGWGCAALARVDPYDADSVRAIGERLDDDDSWVRLNAVGAMAVFGARARDFTEHMREAAKSDDPHLKEAAEKALTAVEGAKDDAEAERAHQARMKQIEHFLKTHRKLE